MKKGAKSCQNCRREAPCVECGGPRPSNLRFGRYCWDCCYKHMQSGSCVECGKPITYNATRCRECQNKFQRGPNHSTWKGGRVLDGAGYVLIYYPDHPKSRGNKIQEHVAVMEDHLGRRLLPKEEVHHKNGIKSDNRLENLELWSTSHPAGQRVVDKVVWAKEILHMYGVSV